MSDIIPDTKIEPGMIIEDVKTLQPIMIDTTPPSLLPKNFAGEQYLGWLSVDIQSLQSYAGDLFRGGMDANRPEYASHLQAALKAYSEVLDDINHIYEYLQSYPVPNTSNNNKE